MTKSNTVIVFDFDGVLFDSWQFVFTHWQAVLAETGYQLTETKLRDIFDGNSWSEMQSVGATQAHKQDYDLREQNFFNDVPFFLGATDLVKILGPKHTLAIVSNNQRKLIKHRLREEDLLQYFHTVLGREDEGNKSTRISRVLDDIGMEDPNVLFVTDTTGDLKEGEKLGLTNIAVSWGYHTKDQLEPLQPDYLFEEFSDMTDFLTGLA